MYLKRHWWAVTGGVLLSAYAVLPFIFARDSFALTAAGDVTTFLFMAAAAAAALANAISQRGQNRVFWALLSAGCFLWTANLALWTVYEVGLRLPVPHPFVGDVILFMHIVPLMAAVALRPHYAQAQEKLYLGTLSFLMLLVWWVFLYAFVVFPDEYVVVNSELSRRSYDWLYQVENFALLAILAAFVVGTRGAWRKIYIYLLVACAMYTASSIMIDAAIARDVYYSGSLYDVPLLASAWLLVGTCVQGRRLTLTGGPPAAAYSRWRFLPPRLAMVAMLSAPLMGVWALSADHVPQRQHFRLLVVLGALLTLSVFVFMRQYLLDHELLRLLDESRRSVESMQRLQGQLVQREKLASLGQMVGGVAHEINNPVTAILGYSELLAGAGLPPQQTAMVNKIARQARRTSDLVSHLLSFAQQVPAEKTLLDLGTLLQRASAVEGLRMESQKISLILDVPPHLPPIRGNANQLLQCFLQITANARDAMRETNGGTLSVKVWPEGNEVVLQFADSGPGLIDPQRVFDPFYTTKPVGQGTGLGLSAAYGVVQDHGGHITCENRPEGGAVFTLRFPVADRVSEGTPAKAGIAVAAQ